MTPKTSSEERPMVTILEGGETLDIPADKAQKLVAADVIYKCDMTDCGGMYHLNPDLTEEDAWAQVEAERVA